MSLRHKVLVFQHARALSIFHKVRAKLEKIAGQIREEIEAANLAISNHEKSIADQREAIGGLQAHHATVTSQQAKIAAILE